MLNTDLEALHYSHRLYKKISHKPLFVSLFDFFLLKQFYYYFSNAIVVYI